MKKVGRPFKKGESGNKLGAGIIPAHLRKFKAKTYDDFVASLETMGEMTQDELKEIVFNGESKNMPIIFGRFILECQRGNMLAMKMLFEYLWGKPKEFDPSAINITPNTRPLQNATGEQLRNLIEGKVIPT